MKFSIRNKSEGVYSVSIPHADLVPTKVVNIKFKVKYWKVKAITRYQYLIQTLLEDSDYTHQKFITNVKKGYPILESHYKPLQIKNHRNKNE